MGKLKQRAVEQLGGGVGEHGDDADVHDLGGLLADDVDAQELHVLAAEEQLEEPGLVADDLAAGAVRVQGAADDVVDPLGLEVLLGRADHADLGDGVDPGGQDGGEVGLVPGVEGVAHGDAGLLHAGGGQGGEADDVAGGVDVRDGWCNSGRRRSGARAGPVSSPAAARFSAAVLLDRPAATSTASTQSRPPVSNSSVMSP